MGSRSVSSSGGVLDVALTIEPGTLTVDGMDIGVFTLNSTVPGPTLRVKAGDEMRVLFQNRLPAQPDARRVHNEVGYVDEANLHWHGLHVTAELPSDDTKLVVGPGEEFQYVTVLPDQHMPGTHWVHPHRHGATALQVGGGAALALIVEDPSGTLPPQVEGAQELVLVMQDFGLSELNEIAEESGDTEVWSTPSDNLADLMIVNGEHLPRLQAAAGEWQRWRVIFAGWREGALDLVIEGCEMQLLAKDGVYINDFPRAIDEAPIPAGGRADIMVRCSAASSTFHVTSGGSLIATVQTSSTVIPSTDLAAWSPTIPDYLQDMRATPASEGCSCTTQVGDRAINGINYSEEAPLHQTFLGAVVERKLETRNHPYHQHIYPFQLVEGFTDTDFFRIGDWHDTFMSQDLGGGSVTVRYPTTQFAGQVMLHCHRLDHEDEGSMAFETINATGSACVCTDARDNVSNTSTIAVAVSCSVVLLALAVFFWRRRRRNVGTAVV